MHTSDPPAQPSGDDIVVVGHQWWWEIRYPKLGIVTANEVHLPAGKDVPFGSESADVIRGPNLTHVADHLTDSQMEWRIFNGGHNMPAFAGILKPEKVNDLLSFLHTRTIAADTRLGSPRK